MNRPEFPALTIMKLFILESVNLGLTKEREAQDSKSEERYFCSIFLLFVQVLFES